MVDSITQGGGGFNDYVFNAFYKLFFAAQKFFQEENFFQTNLVEFKNYLYNDVTNYIIQDEDRINKLLDLNEFFFNFFYIKETKL